MKIGDRIDVQIDGTNVTEAFVEDMEDGLATIVIPATRLVVQVRQSLDLTATAEKDGPDRLLAGADDSLAGPQSAPAGSRESAPVVDPIPNTNDPVPLSQQNLGGEVRSLRDMDFDSSAIDKEDK